MSLPAAPRSLGRRLVATFVAIGLVTAATFLWAQHAIEVRNFEDTRRRELRSEAEAGAESLGLLLARGGELTKESVRELLSRLEGTAVRGQDAAIFGPEGRLIAEGDVRIPGPLEDQVIEASAVIESEGAGGKIAGGSVRIRRDLRAEMAERDAALWLRVALALTAVLAGVAIVYAVTARSLIDPVRRLLRPLRNVAAGAPYEPVEPRGTGELAVLTAQVNGVVAALLEREAENRAVAATLALVEQQVPDAIYRYDPTANRFEFLSASFTALTGLPREVALEDPRRIVMGLVIEEDRAGVREAQRAHLAKGPGHGGLVREARIRRVDGQIRWMEDHLTPEFDGAGRLRAINGVMRDVTRQKAADQALRRMDALTRAITDTALDAMLTLDDAGIILTANPAAGRLSGRGPVALIGAGAASLLRASDRAPFEALLAHMRAPGATAPQGPTKFHWVDASGRELPLEAAVGIAETPEGRVLTIVARDLTHQHEMEAQLVHAQKMEAVGTLASGVAHDFNNLLSVIVGHADLAQGRRQDPAKLQESLDAIVAASARGAELTSRLLGFSRSRPTDARGTDAAELVGRVRDMLARMLDRAIEIRQDLPAGLPPILADAGQIELAVLNLCINARDAMPAGGVLTLSAARVQEADAGAIPTDRPRLGPWVRISVADSGSGIRPEVLAHLFEPFFTTKDRGRGTGLGLAMVYGVVVRGHAGLIGVETDLGHGTRFDLYISESAGPVEASLVTENIAPAHGTETILVVDDDDAVREVISTGLRGFGYRVTEASDGLAALAVLAQASSTSLVVLDMVLPKMGGREVFRRMRAVSPTLPIILSTGYSEEGDAADILRQGGNGILKKPYLPVELARLVRHILDTDRPTPRT